MKFIKKIAVFLICLTLCFVYIFGLFGCNNANNLPSNDADVFLPTDDILPPENIAPPVNKEDNIENTLPEIDNAISQTKHAKYIKSKVNGLNIRLLPTSKSQSIGQINANDMVAFISTEGNWHKTYYKKQVAYVSASINHSEIVEMNKSTEKVEAVIQLGVKYLGTKYVYGATRLHNGNGIFLNGFSDDAFDCSSYMQYIFYFGADILLNLTTRTQVVQGKEVDKENLQRGDLLFFTNANRFNKVGVERIGHVALYLGNNYILHTASDYAVIEPMSATRHNYLLNIKRHF